MACLCVCVSVVADLIPKFYKFPASERQKRAGKAKLSRVLISRPRLLREPVGARLAGAKPAATSVLLTGFLEPGALSAFVTLQ